MIPEGATGRRDPPAAGFFEIAIRNSGHLASITYVDASFTLQEIFRAGLAGFMASCQLAWWVERAAIAILQCRTAALGGHSKHCPDDHEIHCWYLRLIRDDDPVGGGGGAGALTQAAA